MDSLKKKAEIKSQLKRDIIKNNTKTKINNTKILILAPHYKFFIKGLVDTTAKYVSKITILIRHNYLSELSPYLPFSYFRHVEKYSKRNLIDLNKKPKNVDVHCISLIYFIPDGSNKKLGDRIFKKFTKYIQEHDIKFDLIHAHFTGPSGYAGAKLKEMFNTPLIITAHGYDVYDLPFRSKTWFRNVKYALNTADHIITVSHSNKTILSEKFRIPKDKISVIPNGFDHTLFYPIDQTLARKKLNLPLDEKIILNVANLVPVKGHEYLIHAIKRVVRRRRDVLLIIIGGGPLKVKLQQMVAQLGLDRHVKLIGTKPHQEIPLWMNAADLFVLSSLSEGNPTVMFEALGVGLPFVGTTVGGIPEIIISEDHGLLCKPANPKDLAEKILSALKKDWERKKIRKYAEQFTWDAIVKQTLKVYERVLNLEGSI